MKILLIAPLPPPLNGQSLAGKMIFEKLRMEYDVETINMSKPRARNLWDKLYRYVEVLGFLIATLRKRKSEDIVYLTLSESILGNTKDLLLYGLCCNMLGRVVVHMLGGAGMKNILETRGARKRLNHFFLRRVAAIIVEGQTQARIFSDNVDVKNIYVVPNFAEDFLFVDEEDIKEKFANLRPLKILYLSNLIFGKGYNELADAYINMNTEYQNLVSITFVGGFESEVQKNAFLNKIKNYDGLIYYGNFVSGIAKRNMYRGAHIFCLPTYYPYEGQPISILEAYATGCVVVTTGHSGIPDIFGDKINGYIVEKKSSNSIMKVIEKIIGNDSSLLEIALFNRTCASSRHRVSQFERSINNIIRKVVNDVKSV
jgi:glycosyltransferase involved in cell wall biosynthesis